MFRPGTTGSRRPVDKLIVCINKGTVGASQLTTTLTTVTFPCTIVGLRWNIAAVASAGTGAPQFTWAIVHVHDGHSPNTLVSSDAGALYQPEQDVMTWGAAIGAPEDTTGGPLMWEGASKTGRKMMGGDTLQFLCIGEATNTAHCFGAVQFFCKT